MFFFPVSLSLSPFSPVSSSRKKKEKNLSLEGSFSSCSSIPGSSSLLRLSFGPGWHCSSPPLPPFFPAPGSTKERTSQTPTTPCLHTPPAGRCVWWLSPAWHPHLTDAVRGRRGRGGDGGMGCGGARETKDGDGENEEEEDERVSERERERCYWGPHPFACDSAVLQLEA
ncbi:hypothetical protein AVEN_200452-1 [Araneus ventricosus]|uniref:Uncharacterized protein n=1 Tax=Araneus ventricosus TaxID=182803 RepID=A0A4Y2JHC3_ARAVE|nr:hypothetical protein AVEN_200452-1 [Araneus ventricosus]